MFFASFHGGNYIRFYSLQNGVASDNSLFLKDVLKDFQIGKLMVFVTRKKLFISFESKSLLRQSS